MLTRAEVNAVMGDLWAYTVPLLVAVFYLLGFWGYFHARAGHLRARTAPPRSESALLVALALMTAFQMLPFVGHHDSEQFMATQVYGWYAVTTVLYFLVSALSLPLTAASAAAVAVEVTVVSRAALRSRRERAATAVPAPVTLLAEAGGRDGGDEWMLPLWSDESSEMEGAA